MLTYYHGPDLEKLAAHLLDEQDDHPLQNPLAPEILVVQNHGIGRWLSLYIAKQQGIAANMKFEFPSERIWHLIRTLHPDIPQTLPSDRAPLTWSLMQILQDNQAGSEFKKLMHYLQDDDPVQQSVRSWKLSEKIADVFDQYLVYRPDLLLRWEQGKTKYGNNQTERWQAHLWNKLVSQWEKESESKWLHRARLQDELLKAIEDGKLNEQVLPERLTVFGISQMPPVFTEIMVKLSKRMEIYVFQLTAGQSTKPGKHFRNPLLQLLGKQGADFQTYLRQCVDEDDKAAVSSHLISVDASSDPQNSTFQQIKLDLKQDCLPVQNSNKMLANDCSIQVHSCHSAMREAEVLYDQLLAVLDSNPDMSADDILIMTPDINTYASVIEAVFNEPDEGQPKIPYSIIDQNIEHSQPAIHTFLKILDLSKSRFKVTDIMDLLYADPIQNAFDFSNDELSRIEKWIRDNRIRWGIDGVFKQQVGLPPSENYTWKSGLDRMLLGYMMRPNDDHLFNGIFPYDEIETSDDAKLIGRFSHFLNALFSVRQQCSTPMKPQVWSSKLSKILDRFIPDTRDYFWQVSQIRTALGQLKEQVTLAQYDAKISFEVICLWLENQLQQQASGGGMGRGVIFSSLVPMRSIPFKMIGMMGMNDGAFPRSKIPIGFDLMTVEPRLGDSVRSEEDRYLFLENLLSAQTHIYFSYIGQSNHEDTTFPASVILKTFLDYLEENYGLETKDIVKKHPLQAFSPAYFQDNTLFSVYKKTHSVLRKRQGQGAGSPKKRNLLCVHEHFLDKRNAEIGVFLETLFSYSETQKNISQHLLEGGADPKGFLQPALPEPGDEWKSVSTSDFISFFQHPAKYLLQNRLGVYLPNSQVFTEDREPFTLEGLDDYKVGQELLDRYVKGNSLDSYKQVLQSRDLLPDGWSGEQAYHQKVKEIRKFGENISWVLQREQGDDREVDINVNGIRLAGTLSNMYADDRVNYRFGSMRAKDLVELWISHLFFQIVKSEDDQGCSILLTRGKKKPVEEYRLSPIKNAKSLIAPLLDIYWEGLQKCCYFFPDSSFAYAREVFLKNKDIKDGVKKASYKWKNDYRSFAMEGDDPYNKLVLGSDNPLQSEQFREVAKIVWVPFFEVLNSQKH